MGDVRQFRLKLCLHLLSLSGLLLDLVKLVVERVHVLAVLVSHVGHALLVVANGFLEGPLCVVQLLLSCGPQFLLGSGHVKTVKKFVFQSLKFLVKISLLFLCLVPSLLLGIEILCDLAELTLEFPESLLSLGLASGLLVLLSQGGGHIAQLLLETLLFLAELILVVITGDDLLLQLLHLGLHLDLFNLKLLSSGLLFLKLFLEVLNVLLELLLLLGALEDLLFFLLDPGLHVVDDLLHLLLPGGQPSSHLLGLRAQLSLGLELLGQDVLLLERLLVLLVEALDLGLVSLEPLGDLLELNLLLHDFLVIFSDLEEGLDFSVEPPPLPVPQLEVGSAVPLEDSDGVQLLDPLLVVPSSQEPSAVSLELDDQVCDPEVPLLLEMGEHSGAEEDLGLTDPV